MTATGMTTVECSWFGAQSPLAPFAEDGLRRCPCPAASIEDAMQSILGSTVLGSTSA